MKVNQKTLDQIKEQVNIKDRAAFALGVAVSEYELAKAGLALLADTVPRDERLLRLGALQSEFDGYRDTHMGVVVRANAAQKAIGEEALSALGLPESRAFTIDDRTGEVLELVAGSYVPVKEVA